MFTTWIQGIITNWFASIGVEVIGPTLASIGAGLIQFVVLFPLQKYVLLKEKRVPIDNDELSTSN